MNQNSCVVCGKTGDRGLHILGNSICNACERRIITVDANDAQYSEFIAKLLAVAKKAARA